MPGSMPPVPSKAALDAETDRGFAWTRDCREIMTGGGPEGRLYLDLSGMQAAVLREQFPGVPAGRVLMSVVISMRAMVAQFADEGIDDVDAVLHVAGLAAEQLAREDEEVGHA